MVESPPTCKEDPDEALSYISTHCHSDLPRVIQHRKRQFGSSIDDEIAPRNEELDAVCKGHPLDAVHPEDES